MIFILDDLRNFWNHVTAALHLHPVADLYAQALDLVHVMQRGVANGCAADQNWSQHRHRRQFPRAANLHSDVFQLRDSCTRSIFIGYCPARSLARKPKFVLQRCAVDFDDDAIDLIRQRFPFFFPMPDKRPCFVDVMHQLSARVDLESCGVQSVQSFRVLVEIGSAVFEQRVGKIIKPPLRRHPRFKLSHRARRSIARVRK